jgi:hypothetical protein
MLPAETIAWNLVVRQRVLSAKKRGFPASAAVRVMVTAFENLSVYMPLGLRGLCSTVLAELLEVSQDHGLRTPSFLQGYAVCSTNASETLAGKVVGMGLATGSICCRLQEEYASASLNLTSSNPSWTNTTNT